MKENFDALVQHLLNGNIFLEQAIEILEKNMIEVALKRNKGNHSAASKALGIHRNTMQRKVAAYGLSNGRPRARRKPPARVAQPSTPRSARVGVSRPRPKALPLMDLLIFDLDGTLIDSRLDLAHSVNAARAHMGMPPLEDDLVCSYVGNGAPVLIRRALGAQASGEEVQRALEFFLQYYRGHALDCTTLYLGVRDSLDRLRAAGQRMAVLTNKPVEVSRAILSGLGVGVHFFQVYGGDSFEYRKPNPIGVEALIRDAGAAREQTLMAGDSSVDIQTARNAGVKSCGLTYGLQPESLADPAPDLLFDRMEALADWILNHNGEIP